MTNIPEAFSIDSSSSTHKGSPGSTLWNDTAYSTRTSSQYTMSRNENVSTSLSCLPTSDTALRTGATLLNLSSTHVSNADKNGTVITTKPNIVTVTSVLTFTAVRISVYTVPYSLSDSIYPNYSTSLSTARTVTSSSYLDSASSSHRAASSTSPSPVTSTLPPDTTTDTKLVAWGTSGGVAFILIFAFISWWLRSRRKRASKRSEKPTTISSLSWLPWKQKRKEIPRTSFSTYPFKGMAQPTPNKSGNFMNETWSASLRNYRNLRTMDMAKYGTDTQSRNMAPQHLSGYESDYSRPDEPQALNNNENLTSLGMGLDRNSFGQRMVQRGWDGIHLQSGYVARRDGEIEHDIERWISCGTIFSHGREMHYTCRREERLLV
ncbi:2f4f5dca-bd39-409b-85d7-cf95bb10df68-CDS [Sclerotinia trifoliorum]|uniref:2f4f5dca-bd39-409b-85d7-cf95bb10df68-CDS n=1 Tax=Sclerotinia trifoliorum TaxID=28548 RepID=A0A8H2VSX6_9HELO|nr:2f4f5dca-bd39-409b-85d7-cf95bb10df68-CDS [Sclerotinia trifoliorum]